VPAHFVLLEKLPLTPNGKIDRKALPEPQEGDLFLEAYVAPRSEKEKRLAAIWSALLGVERIGLEDNFFSLGGDSIISIRMVSRAAREGLMLSVKQVFEHRTLGALARAAGDAGRVVAEPDLLRMPTFGEEAGGIEARERVDQRPLSAPFSLVTEEERSRFGEGIEDAYPLTALQAGMVFHSQLDETGALYHDVLRIHLKAPWNRSCFEQALERVIAENATLRTGFFLGRERALQFVRTHIEAPFYYDDLRELSPEEQERRLDAWFEGEKHNNFCWSEEPLFRVFIFRRSDESFEYGLSFHHALLDGWSVAGFNVQLLMTYRRLLSGEELPQIAAPLPYREFVALEQATVGSKENRAYWREALGEAPATQLPPGLVGERPGRNSGAGRASLNRDMNALYPGLTALARRLGTPLQHVLLAAHMTVLARLSGRQEVVSCVVFNGRPEQMGGEQTLGLFLNSLPLRIRLERGSWRNLIEQVSQRVTEVWQYRLYPLATIQQETGLHFSEVLFNYIHFHGYRALEAEQDFEFLEHRFFEETNFSLTVNFSRAVLGDGLELSLLYPLTSSSEELAERVAGYYANALRAMVENCEALHEEFSLLGESELHRLLIEWNTTGKDYAGDKCIHRLFAEQAARTPYRVAISADGQDLTYAELEMSANRLAHLLHRRGVTRGELVGLGMACAPTLIVGILGILKAGGAYVPLDPAYPVARLALMAGDAGLRWAVVDTTFPEAALVSLAHVDVVRLETGLPVLAGEPGTPIEVVSAPADLAYVIYTSGSTGQPKGVMVTHANVTRLMRATEAWYGFKESDVWTLFHSYAFDFSVWEIWGALLYGGRLVLVTAEVSRTPELFYQLLIDEQVTVLNQTPSAFRQLDAVDTEVSGRLALRYVIFGGEALELSMLTPWMERHGAETPQLINMYGITETTVHVTYRRITRADVGGKRGSVIGTRLPDLVLYVVDEHLQPVPIGVPGELLVGGAGLARGYLSRPDLTAARFVPNPFGPGRLYRSGDLARRLPDGDLEFLGRIDQQVKIRGFRVELGEIEGVLTTRSEVQAAAVIVREDRPGDRRLVAYVVPRHRESPPDLAELRRFCRDRLPDYMCPAWFSILERLPITRNGKLDRTVLLAPHMDAALGTRVEPRDADEAALCALWADVLNLPLVGVGDNFFELGGHSLLATQLLTRIEDRFAVRLSLRALFEQPTVEGLYTVVMAARSAAKAPAPGPELRKTVRVKRRVTVNDDGEVTPVVAGDQSEEGI
jgi:amino acid adenylation domain-containing protein